MDPLINCPYCRISRARIIDALYAVCLVEPPEGGRPRETKCPYSRCLDCGQSFIGIEAGEGPDPDEECEPFLY
jgi:DNA-directed RNA polymerase subunit RPC12/RpoP